jgi:hypothetical protein
MIMLPDDLRANGRWTESVPLITEDHETYRLIARPLRLNFLTRHEEAFGPGSEQGNGAAGTAQFWLDWIPVDILRPKRLLEMPLAHNGGKFASQMGEAAQETMK